MPLQNCAIRQTKACCFVSCRHNRSALIKANIVKASVHNLNIFLFLTVFSGNLLSHSLFLFNFSCLMTKGKKLQVARSRFPGATWCQHKAVFHITGITCITSIIELRKFESFSIAPSQGTIPSFCCQPKWWLELVH